MTGVSRNESFFTNVQAANLRFQELYWNVRDELGYLEPMRRQLASVLQKQAGSLPNVTLSSNLVVQAEGYAQQFKAQKGDLDGLEELKILYSELQTYLWVTQLFIEQDSPNQEVVEALRKLKGQIVNHSEYLAQRPNLLDRDKSLILADLSRMGNVALQALDTLLANTEPEGFGIQSDNEVIKIPTEWHNQLIQLRSKVDIALNQTANSDLAIGIRKDAIRVGQGIAVNLQKNLIKSPAKGAGAILAGVNIAFAVLFAADIAIDIGKDIHQCAKIGNYMKNMEDALTELLPVMNLLFTKQCLLNGSKDKLLSIADKLNYELARAQRNLKELLTDAERRDDKAFALSSERYEKNIQNFRNVQIPKAQKQAEQECLKCESHEIILGEVGNGWTVCAVPHAIQQAQARGISIMSVIQYAISSDSLYDDLDYDYGVVFVSPRTGDNPNKWNAIVADERSDYREIVAISALKLTDQNFIHRTQNSRPIIWDEKEVNPYK